MSASTIDDEYEEFDDFEDDDDDEPGFSGLMVLLMGGLMLGAMVAVVWVAYRHGVRMGGESTTPPYVSADPAPSKQEQPIVTAADGTEQREVFDQIEGRDAEPTTVIAEAAEEPVARDEGNPLVAAANEAVQPAESEVADRIEALARAVEESRDETEAMIADAAPATPTRAPTQAPSRPEPTPQRVVAATPAAVTTTASASGGPMSGTHVVQIAALGSREDADAAWASLQGKLGDYLAGKGPHVLSPTSPSDTYYRLRVGPFETRQSAVEYCEGLKARNQGCMVRAN